MHKHKHIQQTELIQKFCLQNCPMKIHLMWTIKEPPITQIINNESVEVVGQRDNTMIKC